MDDARGLEALEGGTWLLPGDAAVDVLVGLSLAWIGAVWIWMPESCAYAGTVPAAIVAVTMLVRRRSVLEGRLPFVQMERWPWRTSAAAVAAGVGIAVMAVAALSADGRAPHGGIVRALAPGVLAWLLALLPLGLAFALAAWRMLGYAALLAAGGVLAVWAASSPGWPPLAAGIVAAVTGLAMSGRRRDA